MIRKNDIVEVRLNKSKWIIKITKVLTGYCKGIILKTGQYCDFTLDTIYRRIKK